MSPVLYMGQKGHQMTGPSLFSLLAWLPLVTMSDNPTVLIVLGPTPGSTDGSSSFPLVFVFLLKSLLNCQG